VGLNDLFDVVGGDTAVPDGIGIDDNGGAVLALVEASGHVGAHALFESAESEFLLEEILKLGLASGIAAAARMAGLALIAANEQVLFKLGHDFNVQDFGVEAAARCPDWAAKSLFHHRDTESQRESRSRPDSRDLTSVSGPRAHPLQQHPHQAEDYQH